MRGWWRRDGKTGRVRALTASVPFLPSPTLRAASAAAAWTRPRPPNGTAGLVRGAFFFCRRRGRGERRASGRMMASPPPPHPPGSPPGFGLLGRPSPSSALRVSLSAYRVRRPLSPLPCRTTTAQTSRVFCYREVAGVISTPLPAAFPYVFSATGDPGSQWSRWLAVSAGGALLSLTPCPIFVVPSQTPAIRCFQALRQPGEAVSSP